MEHADYRLKITIFQRVWSRGFGQSGNGTFTCYLLMKYERCCVDRGGGQREPFEPKT